MLQRDPGAVHARRFPHGIRVARAWAAGLCALAAAAGAAPRPVPAPGSAPGGVFEREIRPLLAARCFGCHGPATQKSGLRLDRKEFALEGGDSGAALAPGRSGESELFRRLVAADPGKRMPPGGALPPAEIERIRGWIDAGAEWPEAPGTAGPVRHPHWAFQPVRRAAIPGGRLKGWVVNPIDAFVLRELERKGIRPAPPADRTTLIRRLSLDLLGLPPSVEEVDAFLADRRPGAYERLVDRILASPHFGERWGRHWLDRARYADSNGYTIDSARSMWPYRDWVLRALNADMPFDRFTILQLAGDIAAARAKAGDPSCSAELDGGGQDAVIATGFHRNTLFNEEGGTDREQFRVEAVVDRVNTTGAVWLGLTIACAQCHTHKYDPITQREYYRLFAFFNNADEPALPLPTPDQASRQEALRAELVRVQGELRERDRSLSAEGGAAGAPSLEARKKADPARARLAEREAALQARERELEKEIVTTLVMKERPAPRESFVHLRGDFMRRGPRVAPGVPAVLPPLSGGSTRLDLARWLVDPANPLTPRVTVNWAWQHLFGTGLVETENDFGTQGTPPSHPELLDWLASYFTTGSREKESEPSRSASGSPAPAGAAWSLKGLIRLIVTSNTYRQSSRARPELQAIDPGNRLLARMSRLRLEAETIRDVGLAASGLLSRKIGGPSVYPPQPQGLDLFTQNRKNWKPSEGEDRYRRGLYTFHWRSSPYAMFATFDAPNGNLACTRRGRSNTPLGALMLANDQAFVEMAQALAARVLAELPAASPAERIRRAFRRVLSREPAPAEAARLLAYYESQAERFRSDAAAAALAGPPAASGAAAESAAWTALARVLLNLDETITRE